MMAEQATTDSSLDKILQLICNGDMEEPFEISDDSNPIESIIPGNNVQINEVDSMCSLSEVKFNSREELLAAVRKIALMEGYVTVIRRSKPDKSVYIGCDRGGKYRDSRLVPLEKRKRKTTSRLINCPYEIVGRRKPEGQLKL